MLYRVKIESHLKIILLYTLFFAVMSLSLFLIIKGNIIIGILILAAVVYVVFILTRSLKRELKSHVKTGENEISFNLYGEENLVFPWDSIKTAGMCRYLDGHESLFVYNEKDDRFIEIPEHISDFAGLKKELNTKTSFVEVVLRKGETLKDALKELLEL
ncbi:MAG: hypothetical protein DRP57_11450 [Spirochaetes bacterium]|nr:MAG: hypothetical protein DRP57_11450 [Spirochaetota bacterium]